MNGLYYILKWELVTSHMFLLMPYWIETVKKDGCKISCKSCKILMIQQNINTLGLQIFRCLFWLLAIINFIAATHKIIFSVH